MLSCQQYWPHPSAPTSWQSPEQPVLGTTTSCSAAYSESAFFGNVHGTSALLVAASVY